VGKRIPSLGGLIATMPLTGVIVLIWLYADNPGNSDLMANYTRGAMWGILPSILFYFVSFICFRKHLSIGITLCAGFAIWLIGAFIHQLFLK
jgi:uncharacterized membrane protein (GlpM family)